MELIKKLFSNFRRFFFSVNHSRGISKHVFYRIIDANENRDGVYIIQCINSKSVFESHISEIVFDVDILYGLHPLQSCFIGIEYSKFLKNNMLNIKDNLKKISSMNKPVTYDYGILKLRYLDRKGNICFINVNTNEEKVMSPKDIAFSDEIIRNFHAEHAFFIGIRAGQKIHADAENVVYLHDCNSSKCKNVQLI